MARRNARQIKITRKKSNLTSRERKRLLKAVGTVESIMDEHHLTELDLGNLRSQNKSIVID
jgi:hypothetical protein